MKTLDVIAGLDPMADMPPMALLRHRMSAPRQTIKTT